MKRLLVLVLIVALLFAGCSNKTDDMDKFISLRNTVLKSKCSFETSVTTDYGDTVTKFGLTCSADSAGDMALTVSDPQSISGISCRITGGKGQLTFDDQAVAFEMIADGQITPISAPWLFMKALRGGYVSACSNADPGSMVCVDDSFGDIAFSVDIWLDDRCLPRAAEIIWNGKRIVSMEINSFVIV